MVWCDHRSDYLPLITTFFVSVAANLGTGILGLPVSIHSSGFWPFLFTFTITLFAQLGIIFAATEIITHAHISSSNETHLDYEQVAHDTLSDSESQEVNATILDKQSNGTSLHDLAKKYIPALPPRILFESAVLIHFVAILTSYGLAGPQALKPLLPLTISPRFLIAAFILTCTTIIIFILHRVKSLITIATAFKGLLLVGLIGLCLALRVDSVPVSSSRWKQLMEPYLMGSVALGGVANVMPLTWGWCSEGKDIAEIDSSFVQSYRAVVGAAIIACYLCNVTWAYAVMKLVPQEMLKTADELGEIATVPLLAVLGKSGTIHSAVIMKLVDLFIAVSVTVSFLVIGAGLRHMVGGMAESLSYKLQGSKNTISGCMYMFWFGLILMLALTNPHGFMTLVEGFTSFGLNLEAGFFMVYMFYRSRKYGAANIPGKLSDTVSWSIIVFSGLFFTTALVVDCVFFMPRILSKL